ncbi:MAG: Tex family protein [Burkholderiaceae bacterium]|nr:RNA-binding transcriptional accessory protein [Burkholderiales bacterium]MCZ8105745.1 Tex family protein [Burkholderiales bacterium]MCZ8336603.1 Tex family protein [Burkholderiaceae bacterium]
MHGQGAVHRAPVLDAAAERRVRTRIAGELAVAQGRVEAAVDLLDGGATVPFVARYRKEATGGLDDTQLRTLEERLAYLRELEARRSTIVASISGQGRLTDALAAAIDAAATKQELEDLYLPYKPKRRTKAQVAREAGLEPLADALLADRSLVPQDTALGYVSAERGVADAKAALDGARDILCERFAERPEVLNAFRTFLWDEGAIASKRAEGGDAQAEKFRDYFDHAEPLRGVPSHRALALFRGRQQGVLSLSMSLGEERDALVPHPCVTKLAGLVGLGVVLADASMPADRWLADVLRWCWRVKLQLHFESELFGRLRQDAQAEAIRVFAANLKDLLLGAPAGPKAVMGLDPGLRTGVKVAVVDPTGKLLDTATVYPHEPRRDWDGAIATLAKLAARHGVALVAIGNGTASRETDRLAGDLQERHPELGLRKVVVSEAGASVYSASALAAGEFPDLDVSLRGGVSIARRLQDPLAELVKIDPKSIGVGQYQHDVDQRGLARSLDAVVEDCVNAVGVDVNTASASLLARVSGLNPSIAERIVAHRDAHGPFRSRAALKQVPRLGDKTFEQAAGFLRIQGGDDPLDASAVHPEAYTVVQRILEVLGRPASEVIGNRDLLRGLSPGAFVDERFGVPTVRDILVELEKPGRDPRGDFVTATFREGVEKVSDLQSGMVLEGVVTNVANFGAFVDIGVRQDGLVHVSALSAKFVRHPREVVKAGQLVRVKVLEVDLQRQRIALTMRLDDEPGQDAGPRRHGDRPARDSGRGSPRQPPATPKSGGVAPRGPQVPTAMQAAFAALKKR